MKKRSFVAGVLILALAGFVSGQVTITVPGGAPTIQAAINMANTGDTILVSPGTYVETLVVDPLGVWGAATPASGATSFTIQGSGPGVILQWTASAVRVPAWNPLMLTASGKQVDAILACRDVTGLVLEDLDFDGNDDMPTTGSTSSCCLFVQDGVVTVDQCQIHGIRLPPPNGTQNGVGILAQGAPTNIQITDCQVYAIQKSHIVIYSNATGTVQNCTLTGAGPINYIAENGVQFSSGGKGTVSGCVIDGYWYTPGSWTSSAILAYDPGNPIVIQDTVILNGQTGIYWQANTLTTIDLTITNCDLTDTAQAANGFDGIDIYDNSGGLLAGGTFTVQNCTFNNLNGSGLWTNWGPGGTITGNTFNNNGALYSYNNGQDDAVSPNNWDGNTWSDFTSNAGYPTYYQVPGSAGAMDNSPSGACSNFAGTNVAVGTGPMGLALADLVGGGAVDVVTANNLSDDLTVVPNDGSGGFAGAATTIALNLGDGPSAVATGNLVAGGGTDLAVACQTSGVVRVVDNQGASVFVVSATVTLPGTQPVALCVGDLDGGGTDDIVVAMKGTPFTGGGGLAVSLNGAVVATMLSHPTGFLSLRDVACCDMDGDGDLDVVATMSSDVLTSTTDNILLYENNGSGVFTYQGALSVTANPAGLCCGDLDDDGDPDIAVTTEGDILSAIDGGLTLFVSGGLTAGAWSIPGDFTASALFKGGLVPKTVAYGDLDDDGLPGFFSRMDLVTTNFGSGNLTRFKSWNGTGFASIESCGTAVNPVDVAIGELNADTTLDVVAANFSSNSVTVHLATPEALAQTFGTACAGLGGNLPTISAVGLPTYNNPAFGVRVSNARVFSPALLGVSLGYQDLDLGTGCNLYLLPDFLLFSLFTDGTGTANFYFPVPPDTFPFSGLNAYFQYVIFDLSGTHLGYLAFSNALRIKFGN